MKRKYFAPFIVTIFSLVILFSFSHVFAQTSISGDALCGSYKEVNGKIVIASCGLPQLKEIIQRIFKFMMMLGLPIMVVFIVYSFIRAWYEAATGNAGAYKEARRKVTEALIGFIIVIFVFGGGLALFFKYLGAEDWTLKILNAISSAEVIPRAYAGTASCVKPGIGNTCIFIDRSAGVQLTGKITQTIDSGLLVCKANDASGTVNGDDYVSVTDCYTKADNTLCNLGDYYHTIGVCSGGSASNVVAPPSSICKPTKAGDTCIGRYNGKQGKILMDYGACIAPGDVCNGNTGPGVYGPDLICISDQQKTPTQDVESCTGKADGTMCVRTVMFMNRGGICSGGTTCKAPNDGDACIVKETGGAGKISLQSSYAFCIATAATTSAPVRTEKVASCIGKPNGTACIYNNSNQEGLCSDGKVAAAPVATSTVTPPVVAATADTGATLPDPLGAMNFYDFFLNVLALIMKFFLYPALIGIWVWAGFLYVWAQGAPEKLKKAHNLLFWAVISTLIVFVTNGFVVALKGTLDSILS